MLTTKQFDEFRNEANRLLAELAAKYDANIKCGKIKYDTNSFDMNVSVTRKVVSGKSFEQAEFEKMCGFYGFKPEDYKRKFTCQGRVFALKGFNPKARSMPVLAEDASGKSYKMKQIMVRFTDGVACESAESVGTVNKPPVDDMFDF